MRNAPARRTRYLRPSLPVHRSGRPPECGGARGTGVQKRGIHDLEGLSPHGLE